VLVATASHGILDSFTKGGLGVAFFWPWSGERYFAPIRVIEVSPLSIQRFVSEGGARVLLSELIWVWGPCALLAAPLLTVRKSRALTNKKSGCGQRAL
jgi:inner membrane protein